MDEAKQEGRQIVARIVSDVVDRVLFRNQPSPAEASGEDGQAKDQLGHTRPPPESVGWTHCKLCDKFFSAADESYIRHLSKEHGVIVVNRTLPTLKENKIVLVPPLASFRLPSKTTTTSIVLRPPTATQGEGEEEEGSVTRCDYCGFRFPDLKVHDEVRCKVANSLLTGGRGKLQADELVWNGVLLKKVLPPAAAAAAAANEAVFVPRNELPIASWDFASSVPNRLSVNGKTFAKLTVSGHVILELVENSLVVVVDDDLDSKDDEDRFWNKDFPQPEIDDDEAKNLVVVVVNSNNNKAALVKSKYRFLEMLCGGGGDDDDDDRVNGYIGSLGNFCKVLEKEERSNNYLNRKCWTSKKWSTCRVCRFAARDSSKMTTHAEIHNDDTLDDVEAFHLNKHVDLLVGRRSQKATRRQLVEEATAATSSDRDEKQSFYCTDCESLRRDENMLRHMVVCTGVSTVARGSPVPPPDPLEVVGRDPLDISGMSPPPPDVKKENDKASPSADDGSGIFISKSPLKNGMQRVRYGCRFCPYRVRRRPEMARHVSAAHGVKPQCCQHCPKTFDAVSKLSQHVQEDHREMKPLCFQCRKPTANLADLTWHLLSRHLLMYDEQLHFSLVKFRPRSKRKTMAAGLDPKLAPDACRVTLPSIELEVAQSVRRGEIACVPGLVQQIRHKPRSSMPPPSSSSTGAAPYVDWTEEDFKDDIKVIKAEEAAPAPDDTFHCNSCGMFCAVEDAADHFDKFHM